MFNMLTGGQFERYNSVILIIFYCFFLTPQEYLQGDAFFAHSVNCEAIPTNHPYWLDVSGVRAGDVYGRVYAFSPRIAH